MVFTIIEYHVLLRCARVSNVSEISSFSSELDGTRNSADYNILSLTVYDEIQLHFSISVQNSSLVVTWLSGVI